MKNWFKHTKKLVILALTMVAMLATSMVVYAADTSAAPTPTNLTNLSVGSKYTEVTAGEFSYDTIVKKDVVKSVTLYANGENAALTATDVPEGAVLTKYPNSAELCVVANIKADGDKNGAVNGKIGKEDVNYVNGYFTAKSSDESVASVEIVKKDGKQYIAITAKANGTATINLAEKYPVNPKKPKTTSVKVVVKTLVDDITFDTDVVKTSEDGIQYVEAGLKGTLTLGASVNADASAKTVKYDLTYDANAKKYIKVSTKGVITGIKSTAELEKGYVELRVVAQDQSYKAGKKSVKWGTAEIIRVYVNNPTVKSAKVLNVSLTNEAAYLTTGKKQKAQSYAALSLKTNESSSLHTYKLQVAAYEGAQWTGAEKTNAVTFTSNNTKVATVDKNGLITAKANGKAKITVVPVDGVKLAGKELLTINVNVTTDAEQINVASADVTAFVGSAYTIKASTNANVSVKNDKALVYEILDADTNEAAANAKAKTTAANLKKGKITCAVEGTVSVKISSKGQPDVSKIINITYIDPVTSITAKVMNYTAKKATEGASTTLYVDGVNAEGQASNASAVINTVVKTKIKGEATDLSAVTATSKNPKVATVEKVTIDGKEQFVINAVGAGKTTVTISATDGSKKSAKAITVTVVQKVNDITVANAGIVNGENGICIPLNGSKATSYTFAATANLAKAGLNYIFALNPDNEMDGLKLSGNKLTIAEPLAAMLQNGFATGEGETILLGTLTVEAKDAVNYTAYDAKAVEHVAAKTVVKVYAVKENTYMTEEQFNGIVDAALVATTGSAEGITMAKGEKLNLASEMVIPANVTTRTIKWSATKADAKLVAVKNGVLTASKVTDHSTVTVSATCKNAAGEVVTATRDIDVRVIASQADFNKELNTQITTLLKENNYTWLGGKPTFNAKKATLTFAISDINMGKAEADAEMREKLTNVMKVFRSAAQTAVWDTATVYNTVTVVDTYSGNEWALVKNGTDIVVTENGEAVGTYTFADQNAAIADISARITADVDDLVEWANRTLTVILTAKNAATGYNTYEYVTDYSVVVTVKDASIEAFLDSKVGNAVAKFAAANEANKPETGIQSVTYNADKNSAVVDIFDANKVIVDVYDVVKADAVAALEDIFMNAEQARLQVNSPLLSAEAAEKCDVTYIRKENSDVNALIERMFTKLNNNFGEGASLRNLEGTTVTATVDFDFGGKTYTKTYTLTFSRTVEAIDADADARIAASIADVDVSEYGAIEYAADTNEAVVSISALDAKCSEATSVVRALKKLMNAVAGDTFAVSAELNDVEFDKLYVEGTLSATEVLKAIKPSWYEEDSMPVSERTLSELVGTEVTVVVYYGENETLPFIYTVEFVADMSGIDAQDLVIETETSDEENLQTESDVSGGDASESDVSGGDASESDVSDGNASVEVTEEADVVVETTEAEAETETAEAEVEIEEADVEAEAEATDVEAEAEAVEAKVETEEVETEAESAEVNQ